ncbi:hypothetical protein GGI07_003266 [Coemansia sp. Benny D115]|nr:hypothetical protein GGI07_003266 [Coemansia sp. Benny D115]
MAAPHVPRAAISFTGGKDSVLALHMVSAKYRATPTGHHRLCSSELNPVVLVFFRPAGQTDDFKAHAASWTAKIAQSLGIPLVVKQVSATPSYEQGYRCCIRELAHEYQVECLVTGDIEDIGEGFMDRAVQHTGVSLVRPLWKMPRTQVLSLLACLHIEYVVTMTHLDKLPASVSERLVGRVISESFLLEQFDWYDDTHASSTQQQERRRLRDSVDWAGEYGEMHSMVRDCPLFTHRIVHMGGENRVHTTEYGSYMYLVPDDVQMIPK